MAGLGPWHIRRLCDNPWDGGLGICPTKVGHMTLDQIYMLLVDSKNLRKSGKKRSIKVDSEVGLAMADKHGMVRGRDKYGKPIKAKLNVGGKSLARRLMEAEAAKQHQKEPTGREQRAEARERRRKRREERRKRKE